MEQNQFVESHRQLVASEDIDAAEKQWWERFSEVENKFCWVQTPLIQKHLRGSYLQRIIRYAGTNGNILELGCGTGWLCLLLAKLGARRVTGIDFSQKQIQTALDAAKYAQGKNANVSFQCVDGTSFTPNGTSFDVVIAHAFLHHLSVEEINKTLDAVPNLLAKDGVFITFEPTFRKSQNTFSLNKWEKLFRFIQHSAIRGQKLGFRKMSNNEISIRTLIAERPQGIPPYGPSPKEIPFLDGELERLLSKNFTVLEVTRCMTMSHLVMQEWLLREISNPVSSKLLMPFIARLVAWIEKNNIKHLNLKKQSCNWTFNMFVCKKKL